MSKRGKRYFGGDGGTESNNDQSASKGGPVTRSRRSKNNIDESSTSRADPSNREFFFDEVDEFHNDKEKIYLDKAKRRPNVEMQEEVLGIRAASDEDEDAEEDEDDEESDRNPFLDDQAIEIDDGEETSDDEDDDMRSDLSGDEKNNDEEHLPSADAWGTNRKSFYSTDFLGDEHAGLSGSDIEAADLEEQEAISLQKRLLQRMTDDDYKLDETSADAATTTKQKKPEEESMVGTAEVVRTDLSALSEDEKLNLLNQQSPELLSLIDEYREKSRLVGDCYEPVLDALKEHKDNSGDDREIDGTTALMKKKYRLYSQYLVNLKFYFVMKAMRQSIDNHPVIDRIMASKKLIAELDTKHVGLDDTVERLAKILRSGSSIDDVVQLIGAFGSTTKESSRRTTKRTKLATKTGEDVGSKGKKKTKRVQWNMDEENGTDGDDEEDDADGVEEQDDGETEAMGGSEKRGVTYEIERNKGTTPKRKKEQRNPRVKNRSRFKKAVHKKKSQLPDARKELKKYGGELRGIKSNMVRSVKLH